MITCKEAFERGFAIQTYSPNEHEYKFTFKDKTYTLPNEPWVKDQLLRSGDLVFIPVNDVLKYGTPK